MRLLIIEDNARLAGFLRQGLTNAGFAADVCASIEDARAAMEIIRYDTIVLDLGLPDGDGMELLGDPNSKISDIPVLILTARDAVEDRVKGLNRGTDDYMLKPFAIEELIARIRAVLRRPGKAMGIRMETGNVIFDTVARQLTIAGHTVKLTRRELDVLEILLRREGLVTPKAILENAMFGFGDETASNSIEVYVHRLRKRLEGANAAITIHTVRGVGYLLSPNETAAL